MTTAHKTRTVVDSELIEGGGTGQPPVGGGDFNLREISVRSPSYDGVLYLDHPSVFVQLDIYEDLFSNVIKGTFSFLDTQGWAELIPLIGDETIVISFSTPGGEGTQAEAKSEDPDSQTASEEVVAQKFKIYDCVEMGFQERAKIYKLFFVSEEYVYSKKTKISRGYKGWRYSEMAYNIMETVNKNLPEVYRKKFYIEDTKSLQNVIIPNWTPFQAMNFFASRSLSSDSSPQNVSEKSTSSTTRPIGSLFVFYEKLGSGFFYESIESMIIKQKSRGNIPLYQYRPKLVGGGTQNLAVQYFSVDKFEIKSSFKSLENLNNGMFASKLIAYDPIRMKYKEVKYDYYEKSTAFPELTSTTNQDTGVTQTSTNPESADDSLRAFSNFIATDINATGIANKFISSNSEYLGSNNASIKLATTTHAHDAMFVAPPNKTIEIAGEDKSIEMLSTIGVKNTSFQDQESKQNNVENWLLQRQAQVSEFRNVIITFTVPGNTSRHVGDLIEFAVPSHIPEDDSEIGSVQIGHQLYSGYYIVSKIRHIIKKSGFEMDVELIKNSFAKRIPGQVELAAGQKAAMEGWDE